MKEGWSKVFARVRFSALGGRYERFVSMCTQYGVPLSMVKSVPGGVTAELPARYYREAAGYARRCRTRLRVKDKMGIWFLLRRYRGRWGLILGPFVFLAVLVGMQKMVWTIRYDGAVLPQQQNALNKALYSMDIYEGAFLTQEKVRQSEKILLSQSADLGWVSLNFGKGRLVVEAAPAAAKPEIEGNESQNLYAKADGIILDINVQEGFASREKGQMVAKGDLLVQAGKPNRNEEYISTHAKAVVTAQVQRCYRCEQPLNYMAVIPNGTTESYIALRIGDKRFSMGENRKRPQDICKIQHRPLLIMGFALPATIEEEIVAPREEKTIDLSEEQARQYAEFSCLRQMYQEFPDAQIINHKEMQEIKDGKLIYTIWLEITANIAETRAE